MSSAYCTVSTPPINRKTCCTGLDSNTRYGNARRTHYLCGHSWYKINYRSPWYKINYRINIISRIAWHSPALLNFPSTSAMASLFVGTATADMSTLHWHCNSWDEYTPLSLQQLKGVYSSSYETSAPCFPCKQFIIRNVYLDVRDQGGSGKAFYSSRPGCRPSGVRLIHFFLY